MKCPECNGVLGVEQVLGDTSVRMDLDCPNCGHVSPYPPLPRVPARNAVTWLTRQLRAYRPLRA
jgi:hypothetical protein